MNSKAVIVVRSSGERTLGACVKIIENQNRDFPIHIIEEQPFDAALLACYKIGISSGAKWLITVDADMLLFDNSLSTLIAKAEAMPDNYFQLQGKIYDNISGTVRSAGPRIYRTSFLEKAIRHLELSPIRIRPEYSTIQYMVEGGFPSREISDILSLHDYEQYFKDLYRKAFVHANKHEEMILDLIRRCKSQMDYNSDFRVILKGLIDGIGYKEMVSIDTRVFEAKSRNALYELGLEEKTDEFSSLHEKIRNEFAMVKDLIKPSEFHDHISKHNKSLNSWNSSKVIIREKGLIKGITFLVGALFTRIGNLLKSI
jgi:hypothetical protein